MPRISPQVGLVIPAWNEVNRIGQCLESLRSQTLTAWTAVVVDDGSTDGTIAAIPDDPRIHIIKHPANRGIGAALNTGFAALPVTPYQTWISADNWYEPDFLSVLVAALEQNPAAVLAYSDWHSRDEHTGHTTRCRPGPFDPERLQAECYIGPCWVFRHAVKSAVGPYLEELCEDYYLHLRMAALGAFHYVPQMLGTWRDHAANATNRLAIPARWRQAAVAKAQARWVDAPRRVAYICPGIDAAGVGWLLACGINDQSRRYAMRHLLGEHTSVRAGWDIEIRSRMEEVRTILNAADLIYWNNTAADDGPLDLTPWLQSKPNILHLHAGPIQWNVARIQHYRRVFGTRVVSCTPGLQHARWMPNYLPVSDRPLTHAADYRPRRRRTRPLRLLCHHNYPAGKGTLQVADMLKALRSQSAGFSLPRIKASIRTDWKLPLWTHLRRKQAFQAVIDQITHGYLGMAGWEALAMGQAVLARLDSVTEAIYRQYFGSVPPVINCRLVDDLAIAVTRLAADPTVAVRWGEQSRTWMQTHYSAERIVADYEALFDEAISR
ncbi:MAG: glycosyltransferase [Bacteroidales bacterium]|nr:glycosyltransferase [Bacteroidales bacterium]